MIRLEHAQGSPSQAEPETASEAQIDTLERDLREAHSRIDKVMCSLRSALADRSDPAHAAALRDAIEPAAIALSAGSTRLLELVNTAISEDVPEERGVTRALQMAAAVVGPGRMGRIELEVPELPDVYGDLRPMQNALGGMLVALLDYSDRASLRAWTQHKRVVISVEARGVPEDVVRAAVSQLRHATVSIGLGLVRTELGADSTRVHLELPTVVSRAVA